MRTRSDPEGIAVLIPHEERLDGTGGAVATWVRQVQAQSPATGRLLTRVGLTGQASSKPLQVCEQVISAMAALGARLTPWTVVRWERALWLRGAWYVLLLLRQIRRSQVLYVHNRPRYALLARRLGFRGQIVLHMHNDPVSYFEGLSQSTSDVADEYVFCSEFTRERAIADCGVPRSRTHVLYNGVDAGVLAAPAPMDARLLFVGRIQPLKGPDIALETTANLRARGVAATLTVVGGTEPGMRTIETPFYQRLRARAAELNRLYGEGTVVFKGPLSHGDVLREMNTHAILLAPSRVEEAFGMVIAEAISCGAVPVAPRRGGMPEVLDIAGYSAVVRDGAGAFADTVVDVMNTVAIEDRELAAARVNARLHWQVIRDEYSVMLDGFADGESE